MIIRYIIPVLALLGLVAGVWFTQEHGKPANPPPNQLSTPPSTPYEQTVSGLGIVEANSRNIEVGSFLSGIVDGVMVKEGDAIHKGAPLFRLDDRQAKAALTVFEKEIATAAANIDVASAQLADAKDKLNRSEQLKAGTTVSVGKLQEQRFAVKTADATLKQAIAKHKATLAEREQAQVTLDQQTVRSPIEGRVLKTNITPGEYIVAGNVKPPPMLIGADRPLYLRVDIDENDAWRFTADAKASASLRSNKDISFPLEFVRIEPYVQPKVNINGDQTERVDTRVLQVIYSFDPGEKPVYIGQQMDVFIDGE